MNSYERIYNRLLEFRRAKPSEEEIEAARAKAEALMSGELEMMGSQTRTGGGKEISQALTSGTKKAIKSYQKKNPVPRLRGTKRWH